jgi:hypothetical protein
MESKKRLQYIPSSRGIWGAKPATITSSSSAAAEGSPTSSASVHTRQVGSLGNNLHNGQRPEG